MSAILTGLAMAAPGAIKGINKLFNKPPQQKTSSDTTNYLNKLRNISKEGMYGQEVQNEVGSTIAQNAQGTRAALRSQAVKSGMENSGVVAQQLIQQGGNTTLQAAKMAKQIAQMNEDSKLKAGEAASVLGQQVEDMNYNNALSRYSNKMGAVGDFADALGSGFSGYNKQMKFDKNHKQKQSEIALLDYFSVYGIDGLKS
tara:strand:+ start:133 stop:732 length:600 start_codon:yes stop_codon:yes gene_type:complete